MTHTFPASGIAMHPTRAYDNVKGEKPVEMTESIGRVALTRRTTREEDAG